MNNQKLCFILEELFPNSNSMFPAHWVLQEDEATYHMSKYTKRCCEIQNVRILQWPANSIDLFPIENIWRLVEDEVDKKCPKNKNSLRDDIEKQVPVKLDAIRIELDKITLAPFRRLHQRKKRN